VPGFLDVRPGSTRIFSQNSLSEEDFPRMAAKEREKEKRFGSSPNLSVSAFIDPEDCRCNAEHRPMD
jgi:hypothetical protein